MLDADQQRIPGTDGRGGDGTRWRHLKEVRRVHLEDNRGSQWK